MTHCVLIPAERVIDTLSGIAFGGKHGTMLHPTHVRSALWQSFASINVVNVRLNHWLCSPILLLIVVIELRNGTTLVSDMNVVKKADQASKIRGTVSLLTIPIPLVPFRQYWYRYRTVSC